MRLGAPEEHAPSGSARTKGGPAALGLPARFALPTRFALALCTTLVSALFPAAAVLGFDGRVVDAEGAPIEGAMVTYERGDPLHGLTVWSDADGHFRLPPDRLPNAAGPPLDGRLRVRRTGYGDLRLELDLARPSTAASEPAAPSNGPVFPSLVLEPLTDPAALAAQLPANYWMKLVLDRLGSDAEREEFKRQCTYCHQQGSAATRHLRDEESWAKVIALMGRRGGMLSTALREALPGHLVAAYDPTTAPAALLPRVEALRRAKPPAALTHAVVEEWELGGRASMQHDLLVHPSGRIYSVDMNQDTLFVLTPGGGEDGPLKGPLRESFVIPDDGIPLGGVFADVDTSSATTNSHVGPHSLQVAPDGAIWITLAIGNRLARFDVDTHAWTFHDLEDGFYPHTLRFDAKGRIWFTLVASNHVGMLDPASGEQHEIRLPAASFGQALTLRMMPFLLWLGRHVDLRAFAAESDGVNMPVPYGIDIAPDGGVWFSQLNLHRIGRIDPETLDLEMIDTPFTAPRRLRFDSKGTLWIPGYSAGLIASFDPETRAFREYALPIEPADTAVPYALNVDRRTDTVWICGTQSDTLIRFEPPTEPGAEGRFTVYPMPTRVTYTREIDFDAQGRVWTSNSNSPTWQIEGGVPRVVRLDPQAQDAAAGRHVAQMDPSNR